MRLAPARRVVPEAGVPSELIPVIAAPDLRLMLPEFSSRVGLTPIREVVRNSPLELVGIPEPAKLRVPLCTSTRPLLVRSTGAR